MMFRNNTKEAIAKLSLSKVRISSGCHMFHSTMILESAWVGFVRFFG